MYVIIPPWVIGLSRSPCPPMEGEVMPKTATLGLPKLPVLVPHFLTFGGPG